MRRGNRLSHTLHVAARHVGTDDQQSEQAGSGGERGHLRIQVATPGTIAHGVSRQEYRQESSRDFRGLSFRTEKGPDGVERKVPVENYGIGNLRDAGVAAQAYATGFELLSGEKAFPADRQAEMDKVFAKKGSP
jgi:hypothetical protein